MDRTEKHGAHALLITNDGKVVLQQKTMDYSLYPINRGRIGLYGGGIESGEDELTALRRELKEELGIDVSHCVIEKLNTYHKTVLQDGGEHDVHVYIVKPVDPATFVIDKSDAGESAGECVIDTAQNLLANPNLTRITRLALEEYKKNLTSPTIH